MSSTIKRIYLCIIGILAGLAAWPIAELSLLAQVYFPSYLMFSIFLGLIFGLIMGLFFCSFEGITLFDKKKMISGMITGAIVGIIGGIIGFLIGQAVLFIVGQLFIKSMKSFIMIGFPVSRAVGWSIIGIFVGITEGIRARSLKKIWVGLLGGLLGGALGGFALEYIKIFMPKLLTGGSYVMVSRLTGLVIFGFFIGLFYGFIEKSMALGVFRLLNGKFKGKEYILNQKKIKIGKSNSNDIILDGYDSIADKHALVYGKENEVYIKPVGNYSIYVNDDKINEHRLKIEDVIKIGEAKFLFKYK